MKNSIKTIFLILVVILLTSIGAVKAQEQGAFITIWEVTGTNIYFPGIGTDYTIVVRDLSDNSVVKTLSNISSNYHDTATDPAYTPFLIDGLTAGKRYAFEVVRTNANTQANFEGFRVHDTSPKGVNVKTDLREIKQWGDITWRTDFAYAFRGCKNVQLTATDAPVFSASAVLTGMFTKCTNLVGNSSITNWNTANVTQMGSMFSEAANFNQPLNWNVSNVAGMSYIFNRCYAFNQSVGHWNLRTAGTTLKGAFNEAGIDCANYAATLMGWADNTNTPQNVELGAYQLKYGIDAVAARSLLISKGWNITLDTRDDTACPKVLTGITEPEISSPLFILLQNPVQEVAQFYFKAAGYGVNIIIADLSGKIVTSVAVATGATEALVDIHKLPKGVYIARLTDEQGKLATMKLIK